MNRTTHTNVTASLEYHLARQLSKLAAHEGMTTHAYHVALLTKHIQETPVQGPPKFTRDTASTGSKMSEVITIDFTIPHCWRILSTAAQLRDERGRATPPPALVRQLVMHYCERKSDILDAIAKTDPTLTATAFPLKTYARKNVSYHKMAITCSFDTKQALLAACEKAKLGPTALIRRMVDKALPDPETGYLGVCARRPVIESDKLPEWNDGVESVIIK